MDGNSFKKIGRTCLTSAQSESASRISSGFVPGRAKVTVAAIKQALYGVGKTFCLSKVNLRSASESLRRGDRLQNDGPISFPRILLDGFYLIQLYTEQ